MSRALPLLCLCLNSWAHLNHMQFAAIDASGDTLHIRYRMAADMFLSNLDLEIKSGHYPATIKDQPIDRMIAAYFEAHLLIVQDSHAQHFTETRFTLDDKTGDWIADFFFKAPSGKFTLLCDAFLENNPRTQTLARCDWNGQRDVFHFRKGSAEWELGVAWSRRAVATPEERKRQHSQRFWDELAIGLSVYPVLGVGAWLCSWVRRRVFLTAVIFSCIAWVMIPRPMTSGGIPLAFIAVSYTFGSLLRQSYRFIGELRHAQS